jgi:hypothetical protein
MIPTLPPPRDYHEMSCSAVPWHTSFIGQGQQHTYWLYAIVDRVMKAVPELRSIIELGTGAGALSTVFGLWGVERGIPVHTVDHVMRHNPRLLAHLGVCFHAQDIFAPETKGLIENAATQGPLWLFCDGGYKAGELKTYAPLLPPGSIVSAHDLGVEFHHERDAAPLCEAGIIEPFHPEWWMEGNVQLALYRRR